MTAGQERNDGKTLPIKVDRGGALFQAFQSDLNKLFLLRFARASLK